MVNAACVRRPWGSVDQHPLMVELPPEKIFHHIARWDPRVHANELLRDLLDPPYDKGNPALFDMTEKLLRLDAWDPDELYEAHPQDPRK